MSPPLELVLPHEYLHLVSVGEHPSEAYFLRNSFSSNSTFSPKPPSRPKGDEPLPDESLASMVKLKGRSPAKKVLEDELSVSPSKGLSSFIIVFIMTCLFDTQDRN